MEEYVPKLFKEGWGEWYGDVDHLDPEIHDLLLALNETGLVHLQWSCSSKYFAEQPGQCSRNEHAFVSFLVHYTVKANALIDEILETVLFDDLEVSIKKTSIVTPDEVEVQWRLEFRIFPPMQAEIDHEMTGTPVDDNSALITCRDRLREAFLMAAGVCRRYT